MNSIEPERGLCEITHKRKGGKQQCSAQLFRDRRVQEGAGLEEMSGEAVCRSQVMTILTTGKSLRAFGIFAQLVARVRQMALAKYPSVLSSHNLITLANLGFEPYSINYFYVTPNVADQTLLLKILSSMRDALAAHSQHVRNKLLSHLQLIGMCSVVGH